MDIKFLDTELTQDGKKIEIMVDGIISRVELFRPDDKSGHSGWFVIDNGSNGGDTIANDLTLMQAKTQAMEYLAEIEGRGESVYFADPDADKDGDEGDDDDTGESSKTIDENGQHLIFPDASDYTDEQYDQAKADLDKAKAALHDAMKEKKRASEVAEMKKFDFHSRALNFQIEDARIQSIRVPDRAYVCINARGKLKTIGASEIHTYPLFEISIYQAFHGGLAVDIDTAKSVDLAFVGRGELVPKSEDDGMAMIEREYQCPMFVRSIVIATSLEGAKTEMMCSPDDEHSGCFNCEGPIVMSDEADSDNENEASDNGEAEFDNELDPEDLPELPDLTESVPLSDAV